MLCVDVQDSPDLLLLLRMLSLGQGAWDMIDSQVFKEPRMVRSALNSLMFEMDLSCLHKVGFVCHQDLEVVTRFLPAMMSIVVDDYTFTVEQKLPSEEKTSLTYPTTLPETFSRCLFYPTLLLNAAHSGSTYFSHATK